MIRSRFRTVANEPWDVWDLLRMVHDERQLPADVKEHASTRRLLAALAGSGRYLATRASRQTRLVGGRPREWTEQRIAKLRREIERERGRGRTLTEARKIVARNNGVKPNTLRNNVPIS